MTLNAVSDVGRQAAQIHSGPRLRLTSRLLSQPGEWRRSRDEALVEMSPTSGN